MYKRQGQGWSQARLAERFGVGQPQISRWERKGKEPVSYTHLFKTVANTMLESEGDRSLDAAEDAGRPGCFRAIPVGLAHGFAACFGSYWAFGAMQPAG